MGRGGECGVEGSDIADRLTTGEEEVKEASLEEEVIGGEEGVCLVGVLELEIGEEEVSGEVNFEFGP